MGSPMGSPISLGDWEDPGKGEDQTTLADMVNKMTNVTVKSVADQKRVRNPTSPNFTPNKVMHF